MIGLLLLFQAGAAAPTVGDTIWVARTWAIPAQRTVRPVDWTPPDPIELVGSPQVSVQGTRVEVRYPLTIWRAGRYDVRMPGPLVLGPDGSADSLPEQSITLEVASVLPNVPIDSPIAPQPRAELVIRPAVSPIPLIVLWAVATLLLVPLRWWWWRRGKPEAATAPAPPPLEPPLTHWIETGERRAAASIAATRLRAAAARRVSGNGAELEADIHELLRTLDHARFGSATDEDVLTLLQRATQLEERLARGMV